MKTQTINGNHKINSEERINLGAELASHIAETSRVENDLATAKSQFKARLDELDAKIKLAASAISSGSLFRSMRAITIYDWPGETKIFLEAPPPAEHGNELQRASYLLGLPQEERDKPEVAAEIAALEILLLAKCYDNTNTTVVPAIVETRPIDPNERQETLPISSESKEENTESDSGKLSGADSVQAVLDDMQEAAPTK